MKRIILILLTCATTALTASEAPIKSIMDSLPVAIRYKIFEYIKGDDMTQTIRGIKNFYVTSPASRKSVEINKAILEYMMERFGIQYGSELQKIVNNLAVFPAFKNPELIAWIEQQKKEIDEYEELEKASWHGNMQQLEELLKRGVTPNRARTTCSPLILAVKARQIQAMQILLDHEADINKQDTQWRNTALVHAIQSLMSSSGDNALEAEPCIQGIQLLLKYKANTNIPNNEGKTPLLILIEGMVANGLGQPGSSLEQVAATRRFERNKKILEDLLQAGAQVNVITYNGTPLTKLLSYWDSHERARILITLLLAHGANPNLGEVLHFKFDIMKPWGGESLEKYKPLNYAIEVLKDQELEKLLIKAGAEVIIH